MRIAQDHRKQRKYSKKKNHQSIDTVNAKKII